MWPFWLLFFVAAAGVLGPRRLPVRQARTIWVLVGALFVLVIGLRHEVGGDWFSYLSHFQRAADMSLAQVAVMSDPGHYLLNRWIARWGGSIHFVNMVYAALLVVGAMVFCRRQPNPWLALVVAVPYMLIVVGMGYTRQSVALGFALLGLVSLQDKRIRRFVVLIIFGALFHKSAVLLLPIAALASSSNRWLTALIILGATCLMYYLLLSDVAEVLWSNYVEADMHSTGGGIRVAMNALPAVLLIVFRKRLVHDPQERKLWLWISVFSLLCVPVVWAASTAVDRVALYFIPLQLYVFARLPRLATTIHARTAIVVGIIGYYAIVQFVWLNFATNAVYWVPYRFMPLT